MFRSALGFIIFTGNASSLDLVCTQLTGCFLSLMLVMLAGILIISFLN